MLLNQKHIKISWLMALLVATIIANAQPPRKFYTRIGGNGYDYGYDIKQTLDNGYIITGSTSSFGQGYTDVYLLKLDSMGQIKFQKAIGGGANEVGKSIVQLSDSSYVIAGYTNSIGFGGYDIYLIKTDKTGNELWHKTFGGPDWDFAYSLQATADGGFIIGGTTYSLGRGAADGYVIKTDANGNEQWHKTYGGMYDDEFKSVIQTNDGNYALTGYTKSYNDVDSGDVWVFKLDVNGDSLWCKFYGGTRKDYGSCIIQLQNNELLLSGGTESSSVNGNTETLLLSYSLSTGNQIYMYIDVSGQEEYYNATAQGLNGIIANCGTTKNVTFGYDGLVDIYSSNYGYVNFFSEGSTSTEEFYSITKTKDKGFIAVGKTNGYNAVLDDVFILKMDSTGSHSPNIAGIDEIVNQIKLEIYPNPTSDLLKVKINNYQKENYTLSILDMSGQIMGRLMIDSDYSVHNLGNLASGLYILHLHDTHHRILSTTKISILK